MCHHRSGTNHLNTSPNLSDTRIVVGLRVMTMLVALLGISLKTVSDGRKVQFLLVSPGRQQG